MTRGIGHYGFTKGKEFASPREAVWPRQNPRNGNYNLFDLRSFWYLPLSLYEMELLSNRERNRGEET